PPLEGDAPPLARGRSRLLPAGSRVVPRRPPARRPRVRAACPGLRGPNGRRRLARPRLPGPPAELAAGDVDGGVGAVRPDPQPRGHGAASLRTRLASTPHERAA